MSDVTDDQKTMATQEQRTMAMIAHLSGILTWFVGPLVIWLINKDKSDQAFVIDQAKEALNFQITMGIGWVALGVITIVTLGIGALLYPILGLVALIFCILAGIEANKGVEYRYPFALRLIK